MHLSKSFFSCLNTKISLCQLKVSRLQHLSCEEGKIGKKKKKNGRRVDFLCDADLMRMAYLYNILFALGGVLLYSSTNPSCALFTD